MAPVPAPLPEAARGRLEGVVDALRLRHGADLIGVYRHGSLVTGDWVPGKSDADLLVLRRTPLDAAGRSDAASLWLGLSIAFGPKGVEVHELVQDDVRRDPLRYDFHFSEAHRPRAAAVAAGAPAGAPFVPGRDPELPGYLALARLAQPLFGPPASRMWPKPARKLVLAGYLSDWGGVHLTGGADAASFILNACRTLAWVEDDLVLSKVAGGSHILRRTPPALAPAVRWALTAAGNGRGTSHGAAGEVPPCAQDFLSWVLMRIGRVSALDTQAGAGGGEERQEGDGEETQE